MNTILKILTLIMAWIAGREIWKANRNRELGFFIAWFAILILIATHFAKII